MSGNRSEPMMWATNRWTKKASQEVQVIEIIGTGGDGRFGQSAQETLSECESFFLYLLKIKMTGVGFRSCPTGPPHRTPRTI